jgi:hypothetical protein
MQVRFGPFVLDSESRELLRDGHRVSLSPKAFELLSILVGEQAVGIVPPLLGSSEAGHHAVLDGHPADLQGTFRQMAGVAADPVVQLGLIRNPSPVVHAVLALSLLLIATWLAVYKPFGVTPYGKRTLSEGRRSLSTANVPLSTIPSATRIPMWMYVMGFAVLIVMLVVVLLHLSGISCGH